MNRLKIITSKIPSEINVPFIFGEDTQISYSGERPVLAYKDSSALHVLDKGGSERVDLVRCSDLRRILNDYMFKGTKYIISTYNPTLYYLFPGVPENDALFNSDNNFIPTLPISSIARLEVDGFNTETSISQGDVRCMKACDSWFNNLNLYEEIVEEIDTRINELFSYYKEYDISKEVNDKTGEYSVDLLTEPIVVSLISDTSYTDTINLEDWVLVSKKGMNPISGKLDISYMYSIGGEIYGGMQTIKAFQYEENITSKNVIINFEDIQLEYMNYVLKIYPLKETIDEVVFTDCTLTIGVL
jgi:hypothetical protein